MSELVAGEIGGTVNTDEILTLPSSNARPEIDGASNALPAKARPSLFASLCNGTFDPQDYQYILYKPLTPAAEAWAKKTMLRFQKRGYTVIPESTEQALTISCYVKRNKAA